MGTLETSVQRMFVHRAHAQLRPLRRVARGLEALEAAQRLGADALQVQHQLRALLRRAEHALHLTPGGRDAPKLGQAVLQFKQALMSKRIRHHPCATVNVRTMFFFKPYVSDTPCL